MVDTPDLQFGDYPHLPLTCWGDRVSTIDAHGYESVADVTFAHTQNGNPEGPRVILSRGSQITGESSPVYAAFRHEVK